MTDISVIICCYNSASRIEPTLEHLAKQELDGLSCEAILVDNNCNDDTVSVALKKWEESGNPYPLHIIEEKEPGLSKARKAGVMAAKGEIIVFCDDDNWLKEDYLRIAFGKMSENKEIGVLGGAGIPVSDKDFEIPFWFYTFQKAYAVGVMQLNSGPIQDKNSMWGAGMVLRTSIIRRLYNSGFTNITSDRIGINLLGGGDDEICFWHILTGFKLWYDEGLTFRHYLPPIRLTKEYYLKLKEGQNKSSKLLKIYTEHLNAIKNTTENKNSIMILILSVLRKIITYKKDLVPYYKIPIMRYFIFNKSDKMILNAVRSFNSLT